VDFRPPTLTKEFYHEKKKFIRRHFALARSRCVQWLWSNKDCKRCRYRPDEPVRAVFERQYSTASCKYAINRGEKSRSTLNDLAKQRRTEVEVSKRQVQRLEEEAAKSENAFSTVQEAAKAGGLPKLVEATEADKEKQFQIAGRGYTGSAVYDLLKTYKDEARKVNDTIKREKTKQSFLAGQADNIEKQLSAIDNHIDDLERQIEDYKMYQELLKANQTIANLNIPSGQIERILNTDSMLGELQRLNDTAAVNISQIDTAGDAERLRTEITTVTSFSITDDDLL